MADDLVTIKSFEYLPQAEMAKLHLEEAGITAFIADGETTLMLMGNPVGFVKLQVPSSVSDQALKVLEQRSYGGMGSKSPEGSEATRCLSCGAFMPEEKNICPQCGWSYSSEGTESA